MGKDQVNLLHKLGTYNKDILAKPNVQAEIAKYIRAVYVQIGNDLPLVPETGGNYVVIPEIECNKKLDLSLIYDSEPAY